MLSLIGAGISAVGGIVGKIFSYKLKKVESFNAQIDLAKNKELTELERDKLTAHYMMSQMQSDRWFVRNVRPCYAYVLLIFCIMLWFGYVPPVLQGQEVTEPMKWIIGLLSGGSGLWITGRSFEKIMNVRTTASVAKAITEAHVQKRKYNPYRRNKK